MHSNYFAGIPAATCPLPERILEMATIVARQYEVSGPPYGGKCKALYRCQSNKPFGREVMLAVPFSASDAHLIPFRNEQEVLARISHPGIVKLIDHGQCKEHGHYTALELVDGPTLAGLVRQERRLELERSISLFVQICSALGHLHKDGLVHGSLKANHIILQQKMTKEAETIKLIDFTQAQAANRLRQYKMPELIDLFQTVGHPSPEELKEETIDQRSDIYALGCMLFKVLTGKAPFNGSSAEEIKQKHIEEPAPGLQETYPQATFPAKLEDCLRKMLAKKPEDRYQSADDLALDLRFAVRRAK